MPHRILIIDDDPGICEITQFVLEVSGRFEVRAELDPRKAIEVAREFNPDLILLDVNMPGKNGASVARDLGAEAALAARPIIFLTGSMDATDAGINLQEGQTFVAKTAGTEALLEAVGGALGIRV